MSAGEQAGKRAAVVLAAALLLATLANGAYAYLARLGILDHARFAEIVQLHCSRGEPDGLPLAISCRCIPVQEGIDYVTAPWPNYLFSADGYRLALKLAKEAVFAALLLFSLAHLPRPSADRRDIATLLAPASFLWVLALGTLLAAGSAGVYTTLAGVRSFEFVAIALVGAWMSARLEPVVRAMLLLLAIESTLVAVEMLFGMPLRTCPNSFRASGTLVLPSSLGIATAMAMAFAAAFAPTRIRSAWPWLASAWLVLASGSGTGVLLLLLLGGWQLRHRVRGGARTRALAAGAIVAAALLLPLLTQRPQIYDSLFSPEGRVAKAKLVLESATGLELLIGKGVGAGTNAAANAASASLAPASNSLPTADPFYADSTFISYMLQFGLLGVAAWILLLAWAWRRDPAARPFYLLLATSSLAINITELFPVNFLLGLALAHTLVAGGVLRPPGATGARAAQ